MFDADEMPDEPVKIADDVKLDEAAVAVAEPEPELPIIEAKAEPVPDPEPAIEIEDTRKPEAILLAGVQEQVAATPIAGPGSLANVQVIRTVDGSWLVRAEHETGIILEELFHEVGHGMSAVERWFRAHA